MVAVLRAIEGPAPTLKGDEFIPLMVSWGDLAPCVYMFIRFPDGSPCCEFHIDRTAGVLRDFTIIELPTATTSGEDHRVDPDAPSTPGIPVFDRTDFDLNPDLQPRREILDVEGDPALARHGEHLYLWLRRGVVIRWLQADSVHFGLDAEDGVLAVRVPATSVGSAW